MTYKKKAIPGTLQFNKLAAELPEKREKIKAHVQFRHDLLESQKRVNYQSECDRFSRQQKTARVGRQYKIENERTTEEIEAIVERRTVSSSVRHYGRALSTTNNRSTSSKPHGYDGTAEMHGCQQRCNESTCTTRPHHHYRASRGTSQHRSEFIGASHPSGGRGGQRPDARRGALIEPGCVHCPPASLTASTTAARSDRPILGSS